MSRDAVELVGVRLDPDAAESLADTHLVAGRLLEPHRLSHTAHTQEKP